MSSNAKYRLRTPQVIPKTNFAELQVASSSCGIMSTPASPITSMSLHRPSSAPTPSCAHQEALSVVEQRLRIVKRCRGTRIGSTGEAVASDDVNSGAPTIGAVTGVGSRPNQAPVRPHGVAPPCADYPAFDRESSAFVAQHPDRMLMLKGIVSAVIDRVAFPDVISL